ncbi:Tripeptidyl-peptidase sed2 [Cladophialophora chaetospira]|uniref:tripeptidyl-peptidase II n=1 Tax=Cladophialophora chaetospira TaxID=386627 RepID=A0AA38XCY5_9EURO|nr:Tripeptidyl-peptidase sed2 [Cladophialophora chaetospira]
MSTPGHNLYGQHMEKHEVEDLLQPSEDTLAPIIHWLESSGVPAQNITHRSHLIIFSVTVAQAENLLNTEFREYHYGNATVVRTLQYSVPFVLRDLVNSIQPTTRFGRPRPQAAMMTEASTESWTESQTADLLGFSGSADSLASADSPKLPFGPKELLTKYNETFCNSTITPACLRGIYNIGDFSANSKGKTLIGISGFDKEGAYLTDISDFLAVTADSGQHINFTYQSINSGVVPTNVMNASGTYTYSMEGNLDSQYAISLARGTPVVYYSTGGEAPFLPDLDVPLPSHNGTDEPYLNLLAVLTGLDNEHLPDVLITSYAEDEQSVPYDYANLVCSSFSLLGARGVSVIFASGDTGVGSACLSNDGKNTQKFTPNFPASCPWVTAVGGTYGVKPEIAAAFTSGGFSNYFPAPSWQLNTMKDYLTKLGDKNKGYFNASGRGYPDVSAQAVQYLVYNQRNPTFGAIISNINNLRRAQGATNLGFLNPWLYTQGSKGFNDITLGHSRGCAGYDMFTGMRTPVIEGASWDAIPGWDPVTGWGTPDFAKLKKMMTNG